MQRIAKKIVADYARSTARGSSLTLLLRNGFSIYEITEFQFKQIGLWLQVLSYRLGGIYCGCKDDGGAKKDAVSNKISLF